MSELAFNINGEAFEVPANGTGWRVRRMRAKGSPEVVYSREGLPLVLPIDAGLEELKAEVDVTGRYRPDLVDTNNKAIATGPSGYHNAYPPEADRAQAEPWAASYGIKIIETELDGASAELIRIGDVIKIMLPTRIPDYCASRFAIMHELYHFLKRHYAYQTNRARILFGTLNSASWSRSPNAVSCGSVPLTRSVRRNSAASQRRSRKNRHPGPPITSRSKSQPSPMSSDNSSPSLHLHIVRFADAIRTDLEKHEH
jgi:hypothetical protein